MKNTYLPLQVSGAGWYGRLLRASAGLVLLAALSTCGPGHGTDCLKSTGTVVTQRREIAAGLVTINAHDNVDLRLVQDPDTYAEVRAGENLQADIELTQTGNVLNIANTSKCNWARSYDTPREVTLHLPNITNVFLLGSGNGSTVGEFQQDRIFFHLVGAGDYNLQLNARYVYLDQYELGDLTVSGSTDELNFTLGGTGRLFANGLTTKRCYFQTTSDSDGDAHVQATEAIGGTIHGTGTVYYAGHPASTDFQIKSSGQAKAE